MNKIKQLSAVEACKIAAGEVVERPANALKELLENSLDAGATQIDIYLVAAGKELLRVVDNGCGMSEQDAELCFAQHATSKLTQISDLDTIQTYGFRGEALSSISAVSQVTLITRAASSTVGVKLVLAGGVVTDRSISGCAIGTDLTITNLFYNVPARQKFLKKTETEWRQMLTLFQAFVLQHQQVGFKLFSENKLVHNCPPGNLAARILQLWDLDLCERTLDLIPDGQLSGRISDYRLERYNRNQVFLFVNGRWIKNLGLSKALLKGYAGLLPEGRYPVAILFLAVPAHEIDVNVHPRKEEVLFLRERQIETLVYHTVKQTLEQQVNRQLQSDYSSLRSPAVVQHDLQAPTITSNFSSTSTRAGMPSFSSHDLLLADFARSQSRSARSQIDAGTLAPSIAKNTEHLAAMQTKFIAERHYQLIGQYHETYILIEKSEGLLFIDQHAAHERVLYERLLAQAQPLDSVQLLFPIVLSFTSAEITILLAQVELLQTYGVMIEQFAPQQLVVQAVPVLLKNSDLKSLLGDLLVAVNQNSTLDIDLFKQSLNRTFKADIACKAAVKAGDALDHEKIYQLIDDLEQAPNRFTCPHGRPTFWLFDLKDLEQKFKRDYRS